MDPAELEERLRPWFESMRRTGWRPIVVAGDDPRTRHRLGGSPWLDPREAAPICGLCGAPLQPILQLDLDDLPTGLGSAHGGGLLQLLYCVGDTRTDTYSECASSSGWEPFGPMAMVRVVAAGSVEMSEFATLGKGSFEPRSIVGWQPLDDLPDAEEARLNGLRIDVVWSPRAAVITCEAAGLDGVVLGGVNEVDLPAAAGGDKLGGWPNWVQSVEYPSCPRCERTMAHVFQVDADDHVPFLEGGAAVGHVTQCPDHLDVVAFGWAC